MCKCEVSQHLKTQTHQHIPSCKTQAPAYLAHVAKRGVKLPRESRSSDKLTYKKKSFYLGDIVESVHDGERAAVTRIVYVPKMSKTTNARELLVLMELMPAGKCSYTSSFER